MLFTSLSQEHMEELLPIWKFCLEPSFPHLVQAFRFLVATSSEWSRWVDTPRLATESWTSAMGHRKENKDARCKHNLLYSCSISTRTWEKIILTFNLNFVWLKNVTKNSDVSSSSAVWSQLCCTSNKKTPTLAQSRLNIGTAYTTQEKRCLDSAWLRFCQNTKIFKGK